MIASNLIAVGYIFNSYGIQGWIKIKPYSVDGTALLHVKHWWLNKPKLTLFKKVQAKHHGNHMLAKLIGINTCNAAKELKGSIVFIQRENFPVLVNNEFYWVDLIGLTVINLQAEYLGIVQNLIDNSAHTILCILLSKKQITNKNKVITELLIPFVDLFIKSIIIIEKKIIVDWQLDY